MPRGLFVVFSAFYLVLFIFYTSFFVFVLDPRSLHLDLNLSSILFPLIELILSFFLCLLFWSSASGVIGSMRRLISLLFPLCSLIIFIFQGLAAFISGHYITLTALENLKQKEFVSTPLVFGVLSIGLLICLLVLWVGFSLRHKDLDVAFKKNIFAFGLFSALLLTDSYYLNLQPLKLDTDYSLIFSLIKNGIDLLDIAEDNHIAKTAEALLHQKRERKEFFQNKYPLLKQKVYQSDLHFKKTKDFTDKPNVIIFFSEGISARFIDSSVASLEDVAPNIKKLANQSMVVENYFSHTAPSFRGIKGQLASGFPRYDGNEPGGWIGSKSNETVPKLLDIHYQTIPHILSRHGYETVFFAGLSEHDNYNNMLRSLGFDQVYNVDTISKYLGNEKRRLSDGTSAIPDADLITGLIEYLKDKQKSSQSKPIFLATYNIGTHAFLNVDRQGKVYKDGKNPVLNRFHNFDFQFKRFVEYFFSSPYAKNTVFIFTTDHSTYPEPSAVELVRESRDYRPFFIDQIPLYIYDPRYNLPSTYKSSVYSSLDLAPTLLHLLDLQSVENSFLGKSIFDPATPEDFKIGSVPLNFYQLSRDGVRKESEIDKDDIFWTHKKIVKLYWYLEKKNKIFPPTNKN